MTADFRNPSKPLTALVIGIFAVVVVILTARAASRINQPGVRYPEVDSDAWALRDFRDAIYYPVRAFLDGVSPYHAEEYVDKYPVGQDFPLYSPLTLIVHLPFGWMPFEISQWVYFGMTIALTVALAWSILFVCRLPNPTANVFLLATAILLSRPGHMNLLLGQTTIPLVLCSLWALYFADRYRPWLSGFCVALATLKPTYGVVLIALMYAMRMRRSPTRGILITAVTTIPLVVWVIWMQGGLDESLKIWRENVQMFNTNPGRDPSHSFSRIDIIALWARWNQIAPDKNYELVATCLMLGASCLFLYCLNPLKMYWQTLGPKRVFALLVMLIAVYHHAYDALLLFPIFIAAAFGRDTFWQRWFQPARWAWCGLIAIPLVNYVATNSVIDKWKISGLAWTILTNINGAVLLAATLVLLFAMLRENQRRYVASEA